MEGRLREFIIEDTSPISQALKIIDSNREGFLIVVSGDYFLGTLTDGDIRRALIQGLSISSLVSDVYIRDCVSIDVNDSFLKAIDILSDSRIKFLPIIDGNGKIVNILTKKQLQAALLQNLQIELDSDFARINVNIIDNEIIKKPWGFYKTTVLNDFYQSKVLNLEPTAAISLQSHKLREEYWLVVFGEGVAQIGDSKIQLDAGRFVFIPKGCKHRLRNSSTETALVVVEVQLGEGFEENDIERFEDEYNRV